MKLVLIALLLAAYPAYATTCTEDNTSSCQGLGYVSASCPNGGIACPFNANLWLCAQWSCEDGRYYKEEQTDQICLPVTYKGMSCYDCYAGCMNDEIDFDTCWAGQFSKIVHECAAQGYKDSKSSCTNYISCPSDFSKVRCLD